MASQSLAIHGKTKPYVIAHRGNQVACPENTLAAFRQAINDGADIIETDLHITSDNAFVCIHDETVNRTTDGTGFVSEMTLEQIRCLSAGQGRTGFENEGIPTLEELTGLLPNNMVLALELKTDRFLDANICRQLITELDRAQLRDRTVLISFSRSRLKSVRDTAPDTVIGWITLSNPWPVKDAELLGPLWPLIMLNPFYVRMAHARGQVVCPLDPWPDSRLRLYNWLGCDAVLTNDPASTCRALRRTEAT